MPNEILLAEVEGPKGTAEIFEETLPNEKIIEVQYTVVFGSERKGVPSLGEAHLVANQMVGIEEGV